MNNFFDLIPLFNLYIKKYIKKIKTGIYQFIYELKESDLFGIGIGPNPYRFYLINTDIYH